MAQNQEVVTFSPDEVWIPDIRIYNGGQDVTRTLVLSYYNGTVRWVPLITVRSKCILSHDHYPVDTQACNITMGSWTQDNSSISIMPFPYTQGKHFQNDNPHWNVTSIKRHLETKIYDCCKNPYGTLTYLLRLSRRAPPLWQVVWGPCVALCLLTLAMFWVPPSRAAAKLGLGGAITVALAVLVAKDIAATHAESLVFPTMLTVAAAIMTEVAVVSLLRVAGPAPSLLVKLANSSVGTALAITAGDGEWGMVAQILDRLLCLVFLVAIVAQQASHD
ncbi:hypothetical protein LAZ67_2001292 [Cordylochernes scorpioides]|uniref:Neurotransmitter-gated ion-channel ligand-binding domain-containing protein n=1 Tax=Cordylochernes scorpioides TaxID=51811 RepID=A0ABY6K202_9ARAC|nr:hypothetical protein LAZ67_2001292 [Cordylochernes scorpioides]